MQYLCNHGVFCANCPICSELQEIIEAQINEELDWADDYDEYAYDHFLDLDERALREEEI